jgi:hypothetical protein
MSRLAPALASMKNGHKEGIEEQAECPQVSWGDVCKGLAEVVPVFAAAGDQVDCGSQGGHEGEEESGK